MAGLATAAVGGAIISGINANNANKQAGKALSAQERMAQNELDFKREQYNRYLGLFGPTEERLAREAQSDQPLDYDKNKAAITQNTGQALRNINTQMGMRGMAGSGLDVGANRAAMLGQAGQLSNAFSTGLENRRNLGLTLTGRGQIQNAAQGVGQGVQNLGNFYSNMGNLYGGAAQAGWNNFSGGLDGLTTYLASINKPKGGGTDEPITTTGYRYNPDTLNPIGTEQRDQSDLFLTPGAM